jgi:transposase InsO family protein
MTIRSDRGTQFVNGIISQLLSLLQIGHELSLAYSKEQNAIVERANKEVIRHLTAIIFDRRASEV